MYDDEYEPDDEFGDNEADFDVNCPKCGEAIYEGIAQCPHCHEFLSDSDFQKPWPKWMLFIIVLTILSFLIPALRILL